MGETRTANRWSRGIGREAARPSQIPARDWKDIVLRVWDRLGADHVSIVAAGVAFYGFLALFPALIATISVYGLFADPLTVHQQLRELTGVMPEQARAVLTQQLSNVAGKASSTLGMSLLLSLLLALWSARKGANALLEGMNIVYEEKDDRGFLSKILISLAFTLGGILVAIVCAVLVVAAPAVLGSLGLSASTVLGINIGRWLVLALIGTLALAVIYRFGPDRTRPKWRWVSWGAVTAVALWLLASWGFSAYVSHFGSYDKTYGSLAAIVVLLLWLYLSSYIVLLGAEINSEMEHQTARDSTAGAERPLGERGGHFADSVGSPRSRSG